MLSVVMLCVFMLSDGRNALLSIADCPSAELILLSVVLPNGITLRVYYTDYFHA